MSVELSTLKLKSGNSFINIVSCVPGPSVISHQKCEHIKLIAELYDSDFVMGSNGSGRI